MIRINLLRDLSVVKKKQKINIRLTIIVFAVFCIAAAIVYVAFKLVPAPVSDGGAKNAPLIRLPQKLVMPLKRIETPFDVVEDIVDDIHGGRFKVESLNRLSSPEHLSANERKLFERLFVRNAFAVFNSAIKAGMGFNTITIAADGSFFIFGITPDEKSAMAFQKELTESYIVSSADELSFENRFGESRRFFALKGFLNFNFIESAYEDDSWDYREVFRTTREQTLYDAMKIGESHGVRFKNKPEWIRREPFADVYRTLTRLQVEATYPALMKWISDISGKGVQLGFTKMNLTSVGGGKILAVAEIWLYSRN